MPTRRRRVQEVAPGVSAAEAPPETADEGEGPGLSLFDASGDNRVRCLWRDTKTQKWVTHGYFPPTVKDEDILREFGGGEYMLQLLVQTPDRGEQIKQTRRVRLPGVHRIPTELPGIHREMAGASTTQNGKIEIGTIDGMSPVAALNTALVASVVDLLKSFKDSSRPQQPPPQPINWTELVSGAVQLATLFKREKPDMSPLDMLKAVKELMPSPAAASAIPGGAANTVSDMVKGMKELMGLKDIVEGRESPPDPETAMWGAGMKALEIAGDYLTGRKGGGGESTAVPGNPKQAALPPGTPRWKIMLLAQKKQLLQAASFGLNADTAAELALTYLPQQMRGVLTEFLTMPDHVAVAIQTIPELGEFTQWTADFFAELRVQFMGEEEEDAEEGSERQAGQEGPGTSDSRHGSPDGSADHGGAPHRKANPS